jgi:hypothetical protein
MPFMWHVIAASGVLLGVAVGIAVAERFNLLGQVMKYVW